MENTWERYFCRCIVVRFLECNYLKRDSYEFHGKLIFVEALCRIKWNAEVQIKKKVSPLSERRGETHDSLWRMDLLDFKMARP